MTTHLHSCPRTGLVPPRTTGTSRNINDVLLQAGFFFSPDTIRHPLSSHLQPLPATLNWVPDNSSRQSGTPTLFPSNS